ncbi:DUF4268 domain-containing protein [Pseudorhodoplanes sp.]|uniref:DUF4268 domain-containing protein n=1 Tax=Pseudorhodoplanes sp. TaxID=1934341 RepID=UPI003D099A57
MSEENTTRPPSRTGGLLERVRRILRSHATLDPRAAAPIFDRTVELYIGDDPEKALFDVLHQQRAKIERELGHALVWRRLPERKRARILGTRRTPIRPTRASGRSSTILATMDKFKTVFVPRVTVRSPSIATSDDRFDQDADDNHIGRASGDDGQVADECRASFGA